MRASSNIVSGQFFGAQIEPGTFHLNASTCGVNAAEAAACRGDRTEAAAPAQTVKPDGILPAIAPAVTR